MITLNVNALTSILRQNPPNHYRNQVMFIYTEDQTESVTLRLTRKDPKSEWDYNIEWARNHSPDYVELHKFIHLLEDTEKLAISILNIKNSVQMSIDWATPDGDHSVMAYLEPGHDISNDTP